MPTTYAIPDGRTVMAATTYTGNSTNGRAVSNDVNGVSFQPDWVWIKSRSQGQNHQLFDVIRGTGNALASNTTAAAITNENYGYLSAFNSTGFALTAGSLGSDYVNQSGQSYVGWQWKAGGTAVSNTAGSITSSVSANTTAGFSVVTYSGNATGGATVGHGLGVAPSMMIVKRRDAADDWRVYHISIGATQYMDLNTTAAAATANVVWNSTAPTSSVFSIGTSASVNSSSGTYVGYCFAPVAGYSAFGSYTGNGSADGPFVYLGFKPRFLLIRSTSNLREWFLVDTSRNSFNVANSHLRANTNAAEGSDTITDIVSNGFKLRSSDTAFNASGETYIYMAFAENPFKYANAR